MYMYIYTKVLPRGLWRQGHATPYRLVTEYALCLHSGLLHLNKRCTNLLYTYVLRTHVCTCTYVLDSIMHVRCHDLAKVQGNQVDYFLVSCTVV